MAVKKFSAKLFLMDNKPAEPRRLRFIYRWLLKGRLNYYSYFLDPNRSSFLLRQVAKRFHWAQIPEPTLNRLQELREKGKLVYAIKHRSRLDFIFLHHLFNQYGLNPPLISMEVPIWPFFSLGDMLRTYLAKLIYRYNFPEQYSVELWGEAKERFEKGEGMLTYLINPHTLTTRYLHPEEDPFYNLLLWQEDSEEDFLIVPLVIVFDRAPERTERGLVDFLFGPQDQPGPIRKLYNYLTLTVMSKALLEIGDPVNIRDFVARKDQQGLNRQTLAHRLREHLLGHLEREKRVILGPRIKPRSMIMEDVLQDQSLNRKLEELAKQSARKAVELKRESAEYLDEMAANYNQPTVDFLDQVLTIGFKNLYEGIEVDETGFEKIRNIAKKYNVVYVPSHKSHIDYLILSYILYHRNFSLPHIVAGINLNFFPVGPIFRGCGAFFMRRTFKGNKVYAAVFSTYLKMLLREGYPLEFFIEGGRSRTGRLLLPRLGVVKYIVNAFQELSLPDLYFVPVYIGYDQVIEQGEYVEEMTGEKEKGNALFSLLRSWRLIRENYGKIYLNFGEPISLRNYIKPFVEDSEEDTDLGFEDLGYSIVSEINRLTLVSPGGLIACALLASAKPARRDEDLFQSGKCFRKWLEKTGARMADSFETVLGCEEEALGFYQKKKLIETSYDEVTNQRIISVPEDKRLRLEFYKNSIIHFFLAPAMLSLLRLNSALGYNTDSGKLVLEYKRLKRTFRFDFVMPEGNEEQEVELSLSFLESECGMNETLLKSFAGLFANFLESYIIALRTLLTLGADRCTEEEFLDRAQKMGKHLYKLREIDRFESISRLNFQSALKWMQAEGFLKKDRDYYIVESTKLKSAEKEMNWLLSLLSPIRYY